MILTELTVGCVEQQNVTEEDPMFADPSEHHHKPVIVGHRTVVAAEARQLPVTGPDARYEVVPVHGLQPAAPTVGELTTRHKQVQV